MPPPKTVKCYLCQQQFGKGSLKYHQKACYQKCFAEWKKLPKQSRGPPPTHPDDAPPTTERSTRGGPGATHGGPSAVVGGQQQCRYCGRSFDPARVQRHETACQVNPDKQKNSRAVFNSRKQRLMDGQGDMDPAPRHSASPLPKQSKDAWKKRRKEFHSFMKRDLETRKAGNDDKWQDAFIPEDAEEPPPSYQPVDTRQGSQHRDRERERPPTRDSDRDDRERSSGRQDKGTARDKMGGTGNKNGQVPSSHSNSSRDDNYTFYSDDQNEVRKTHHGRKEGFHDSRQSLPRSQSYTQYPSSRDPHEGGGHRHAHHPHQHSAHPHSNSNHHYLNDPPNDYDDTYYTTPRNHYDDNFSGSNGHYHEQYDDYDDYEEDDAYDDNEEDVTQTDLYKEFLQSSFYKPRRNVRDEFDDECAPHDTLYKEYLRSSYYTPTRDRDRDRDPYGGRMGSSSRYQPTSTNRMDRDVRNTQAAAHKGMREKAWMNERETPPLRSSSQQQRDRDSWHSSNSDHERMYHTTLNGNRDRDRERIQQSSQQREVRMHSMDPDRDRYYTKMRGGGGQRHGGDPQRERDRERDLRDNRDWKSEKHTPAQPATRRAPASHYSSHDSNYSRVPAGGKRSAPNNYAW